MRRLPFILSEGSRLRRTLQFSAIGVGMIVVYAIGIIVATPLLIARALDRFAAATPERSATVGDMRVNPFTLEVTLSDLSIRDEGAGIAFTAPSSTVNFDVASLVRRFALDAVTIEAPTVTIERPEVLAGLADALSETSIETLALHEGRLELADSGRDGERGLLFHAIDLDAQDVDGRTNAATGGRFELRAMNRSGGRIDLDGSLAPGLTGASGRIAVTGLDLDALRPWLAPPLAGLELHGLVDFDGEARVAELMRAPALTIDARADLRAFELAGTGLAVSAETLRGFVSAALAREETAALAFRFDVEDQRFVVTDARTPGVAPFALAGVNGSIAAGGDPDAAAVSLTGELTGAGRASLELRVPSAPAAARTLSATLDAVPVTRLVPYLREALGLPPGTGTVDLALDYTDRDARPEGRLHIRGHGIAFEATATDQAAGETSALAVALLTDRTGMLELDVEWGPGRNARGIGAGLQAALRARLAALAAAPFVALSPLAGLDPNALREVPFEPGAAGLEAQAQTTIDGLARALQERPGLGVRALGGFSAQADRNALARQQIELHVLLATAGPSPQARPQPVDFASPRAQDVLDEFAGERLSAARRAAIAMRFECADGDAVCRTAYYAAVFDALAESEPIADATLTRLGRFRAQSIANALIARGIDAQRVATAGGVATTRARSVTLPLEVFAVDSNAPRASTP